MIALLAAAALQVPAPSPPPAPAPPAPVSGVAPEADLGAPSSEGLESLRQAYHDSCEVRLYGEYDDMCSAMSDQIRRYRAALAKAGRKPRAR